MQSHTPALSRAQKKAVAVSRSGPKDTESQNLPGPPAVWTPTYHLDGAGVLTEPTPPTLGPEPLLLFLPSSSFSVTLSLLRFLLSPMSCHYQLSHVLSIPFYKSPSLSHALSLCIPLPLHPSPPFLFLSLSLSTSFCFPSKILAGYCSPQGQDAVVIWQAEGV